MNSYVKIAEVMENFNFKSVRTAMEALNWRWATTSPPGEIPTIKELQSTAYNLLHLAVEGFKDNSPDDWYECSTGGFVARIEAYNNDPRLTLLFYVDRVHNSTSE